MSEKTVVIAHVGAPFTPPEIPAAGGVVIFEPNPNGGKLWLGSATVEEAAELLQFDFFMKYEEEVNLTPIKGSTPDKEWTREGIAEWALEHLQVVIDIKKKSEMLDDLASALAAKTTTEAATEGDASASAASTEA